MDNNGQPLQNISMQDFQQKISGNPFLQSALSGYLQPGATLQNTQQNTQTSQQEQQTSGQQQTNLETQQPGEQATSTLDQINALKAQAPLSAATDIKNGMTWDAARTKYSALGMSSDDIFQKYIANTSYGLPKESADTLKSQGVSQKSLGAMDQPGDFLNRQNVASTINDLNKLENLYNSMPNNNKYLPGGKLYGAGKEYESLRTQVADSLGGLFPNTPNGEQTANSILNTIPGAGDPANYDISSPIFSNIKGRVLTQNGYTDPKQVGLTSADLGPQLSTHLQTDPQHAAQAQGSPSKQVLTNQIAKVNAANNPAVVPTAAHPLGNVFNPGAPGGQNSQSATVTPSTNSPLQQLFGGQNKIHVAENSTPNGAIPLVGATLAPTVADLLSDGAASRFNPEISSVGAGGGQILQNALYKQPLLQGVPQTMATTEVLERTGLGASKLIGGGAKVVGESGATQRMPAFTKSLMRTGAAIGQTNNARSALVQDATTQGIKVSGDDIYQNMVNWGKNRALGASSDVKNFVQDVLSNAKSDFAGKTFTPQELKGSYDEIPEGYTATGKERTPLEAQSDVARKQAMSNAMGKNVKGWNEANAKFRQLNELDKSPLKKYTGRAIAGGASGLMTLLGLEGYKNLVSP